MMLLGVTGWLLIVCLCLLIGGEIKGHRYKTRLIGNPAQNHVRQESSSLFPALKRGYGILNFTRSLVGLDLANLGIIKKLAASMNRAIQLGDMQVDAAKLAELCQRYSVRELSVFGSAARGEMRADSDIDLLVEFLPDAETDLVDHAGLMLDISELVGRKVDLVSKNGLKPLIRDSVLEQARLLYAA